MVWFHLLYYNIFGLLHLVTCDHTLHVVYSDFKPFIFTGKQGDEEGIIPTQLKQAKNLCDEFIEQPFQVQYHYNESINTLYNSLLESNKTLQEILPETKQHHPKTDNQNTLMIAPYYTNFYETEHTLFSYHQLIHIEMIKTKQTAVIMRRKHISLIRKLVRAQSNFFSIAVFYFLELLIFVILISVGENISMIRNGIPISKFLLNSWLAVVTTTSVGYGDYVPLTVAGKVLDILWMIVAMIVVCILTAYVSTNVLSDLVLDFENEKIAILNNSYETNVVAINYPNAAIVTKNSYGDIIEAVVNEDVKAGSLNADYASWLQDELRDQQIHVVHLL